MISSSSEPVTTAPAMGPVLSVIFMAMTPCVFRPVVRNVSTAVRFP